MASVSKKRRREEKKTTDEEMMKKRIKLEDNVSIAANDHLLNTKSSRKTSRSSEDSTILAEERSSQKRRRIEAERLPEHVLTNYKFHWSLGRGSFGKVFLASLPIKKEEVAVKVIRKIPKGYYKDMIQKEARILKVTSGSPFLCHGYAAFQTNQYAFLVMEYAGGGSLSNLLSIKHHLKKRHLVFYSAELICGLQHLHSLGIIHRDLKPDNILLTCEGHMKIADFGIAAGVFDRKTIGGIVGTNWYMAPEMLANKKYNAAIDWWAFAIILSEMATGRSPFESYQQDGRSSMLTEKPVFPEWMSETLQDLLQKLLKKRPHKRLGVNGNIREHQLYKKIKWEDVENQRIPPPIRMEDNHPEFTDLNLPFLQCNTATDSDDTILTCFTYLNPSW